MRLRSRLKKNLRDTLEHISCLPGVGKEVDDLLNIHHWPTVLSKDAMFIIAEYTRDVPTRWVYIRRDYRLETKEEPDPRAGGRVVKNADVKIIKSSCKNSSENTYDASGNCFLNKNPNKVETAEPFSTDEENEFGKAGPSSTSTPKEALKETPKEKPRASQGLAGQKQTIIRHTRGYYNMDPTIHSPPDPARAQVAKNCAEKCERIRTEIESRSLAIKSELIRAIERAQTLAKRRKRMKNVEPKVAIWVEGHLEQQNRKTARAFDKEENRAKPNGKRYMPALENQYESSETYDSDSEDSIPEVVWNPKEPQGLQGQHNQNPKQR